jgi:hypothetical protein
VYRGGTWDKILARAQVRDDGQQVEWTVSADSSAARARQHSAVACGPVHAELGLGTGWEPLALRSGQYGSLMLTRAPRHLGERAGSQVAPI